MYLKKTVPTCLWTHLLKICVAIESHYLSPGCFSSGWKKIEYYLDLQNLNMDPVARDGLIRAIDVKLRNLLHEKPDLARALLQNVILPLHSCLLPFDKFDRMTPLDISRINPMQAAERYMEDLLQRLRKTA